MNKPISSQYCTALNEAGASKTAVAMIRTRSSYWANGFTTMLYLFQQLLSLWSTLNFQFTFYCLVKKLINVQKRMQRPGLIIKIIIIIWKYVLSTKTYINIILHVYYTISTSNRNEFILEKIIVERNRTNPIMGKISFLNTFLFILKVNTIK